MKLISSDFKPHLDLHNHEGMETFESITKKNSLFVANNKNSQVAEFSN